MDFDKIFGFLMGTLVGAVLMSMVLLCYITTTYNEVKINNRTCYEIKEKIYCEWSEE